MILMTLLSMGCAGRVDNVKAHRKWLG